MATKMTIYSWNMFYKNRELDRAFDFIAHADFDIFCLQEVPETFLKQLATLPYHMADTIENDVRAFNNKSDISYAVTLSKYPIIASHEIQFVRHTTHLPLRSHAFAQIMRNFRDLHLWIKGIGNRHALVADIETPRDIIRICNIHLLLMNPFIRAKEFELIMRACDSRIPAIVCGDFNILEKPHITVLNWLLGGRLSDMFLWRRERADMERRFAKYGLYNPLRGHVTHPLSRSQLDHILVPKAFSVTNRQVIADRHGSDHCPVRIDIA